MPALVILFCDDDVLCCRVLAVTGGGVSMVSRRKILSRSRDDLNLDTEDYKEHAAHHQDDTWYSKEKLYKVLHESFKRTFAKISQSRRKPLLGPSPGQKRQTC